jgi:acyl-CoA synthetase (NDP forming)
MKINKIFEKVKKSNRNNLTELESREILEHYKIPLVKGKIIKTIDEAKKFIEKIGYPVVLKVVSRQIIHKSDVGGVIVDIDNEKKLFQAYNEIINNVKENASKATIEGFFIQEMISGGHEVIVGSKLDPTFGQTIAFGLGGIFVEVFEDISFRVNPITKKDALEMIKEIKGYKILKGYRNQPAVDLDGLIDIIMKTSKIIK